MNKEKKIFVSYKGYDQKKYRKKAYIDQLQSIFNFAKRKKFISLFLNFTQMHRGKNIS